jgi:prephenate dehydrogenase
MKGKRVAIVGLGLIGGSLAMALKRARPQWSVVGCDRPEVLVEARRRAVVDETEADPVHAVRGAEIVVLASPVETIVEHISKLAPSMVRGTLVTDVGSTKRRIMEAAETLPSEIHFVGGHPMAGKSSSGLRAAEAELFRGAPWALVPRSAEEGSPSPEVEALSSLVRAVGADPIILDAATHDRAVAVVSQLPQLLALVLCEQAGAVDRALELAGPVFRKLSRLAGSSSSIWQDIFSTNQDMVGEAVAEIGRRLQAASADLAGAGLESHFEAARRAVARNPKLANLQPPGAPDE